jgi:hypothetical protein
MIKSHTETKEITINHYCWDIGEPYRKRISEIRDMIEQERNYWFLKAKQELVK